MGCSAILVSNSELLKHRRETDILDPYSVILVSSNIRKVTHILQAQPSLSVVLIYTDQGATHKLDTCSVSGSDLLKVVKLTSWMYIQQSVVLICSKSDSLAGCMFINGSDQLKKKLESNLLATCSTANLISGSDLLKHLRITHSLDVYALVSSSNQVEH